MRRMIVMLMLVGIVCEGGGPVRETQARLQPVVLCRGGSRRQRRIEALKSEKVRTLVFEE